MVKIVKSKPTFHNGVPGLRMKFPAWDIDTIDQNDLKGLYRGDLLYFRYKAKDDNEDKKINTNPLVLFEGLDQNGNIVGTNLMFLNMFIDPKTSQKQIKTRLINPVFDTLHALYWNDVIRTGQRKSYKPLLKKNFIRIFGRTIGADMQKFWRTYKREKIRSLSNITIDSALNILSTTKPTYIRATKTIR